MSLSDFWADLDRRAEQARLPAPKAKREPAVYRAMTADEVALATALGRCSFSVGSFDKRFARDISAAAAVQQPLITAKQADLLRRLVTRYRRQIRATDVPEAERHLLTKPKVS